MILINATPSPICNTTEPITYKVSNTSDSSPIVLSFEIKYFEDERDDIMYGNKSIELRLYATNTQGLYHSYEVDISDIVSTYVFEHLVCNDVIIGYAKVRLVSINNDAVSDSWHICIPGSSGGLGITGSLAVNQHPFLLSRGNEIGALHYYRSELMAMEYIYAKCSNFYEDYHIDTDNRESDDQDLADKLLAIEGTFNLIAIRMEGSTSSQYSIDSDANALYLTLEHDNTPHVSMIAINDDPDADEFYLIRWTNSMGVRDALLLTGELQDISDVEKQDPYITSQDTSGTKRTYKRGLITNKYSLQTGYLTPARIIALFDMLSSEEVALKIDDKWVPVSVTADVKHAVHQREPESFELTIEVLEQTRYHKPNRTVRPLPDTRSALLQDNRGNIILDNNSNTIQENGSI